MSYTRRIALGIMADCKKRAKVPRRPNFKAEDLELLAECVETHKGELFGKFSSTVTTQSKSLIWDRIAKKLNSNNITVQRTGEELKRKWTDWASSTKTKNARRKVTRRTTGRGPAVPDPTDLESKVLLVIGQDSVEGFDGWIDTGVTVPNTPRMCAGASGSDGGRRDPRYRHASASRDRDSSGTPTIMSFTRRSMIYYYYITAIIIMACYCYYHKPN